MERLNFYYLGPVRVDPLSAQNEKLLDKGKTYSVVTMNMVTRTACTIRYLPLFGIRIKKMTSDNLPGALSFIL